MARIDVIMPQMGESIAEGTVSRWLKKVGDEVKRDEPIFEISTDKVDAEIPSPSAGVLAEIIVGEGKTVSVQTVVARIETEKGASIAAAPVAAPAGTRCGAGAERTGSRSRCSERSGADSCAGRSRRAARCAGKFRRAYPHEEFAARAPHRGRAWRGNFAAHGKRHRRSRYEARSHRIPRERGSGSRGSGGW